MTTPRRERLWFPTLLVLSILIATGVFAVRPMASYLAIDLGASTFELGLLASAFGTLAIIFVVPIGRIIDRYGYRVVIRFGTLIVAVACVSVLSMTTIAGLIASLALLGLGQLMTALGAQTMLIDFGAPERQADRIGLYSSLVSIGHAIGPGVAGAVAGGALLVGVVINGISGDGLVFVMAAACSFAAFGLSLLLPDRKLQVEHPSGAPTDQRLTVRQTLGLPGMPQALAASIAVLVTVDMMVAYLPAYGVENAIEPEVIGVMLATIALAQMFSRLLLGRFTRNFGLVRILVVSMLVPSVLVPAILFVTNPLILFMIMLGIGWTLGIGQPLTLVWLARAIPRSARGLATSLRIGANRLGQLLLPATIGATAGQAAGVPAIFAATAAMLAGAAGFVWIGRHSLKAEQNAGTAPPLADRTVEAEA